MLDVKPQVVVALENIGLPVYYEAFISAQSEVPAISYIEILNNQRQYSEQLEYSDVVIQVKVWSRKVDELTSIALQVHEAMRALGFRRENSIEQSQDGVVVKIMRFRAITKTTI